MSAATHEAPLAIAVGVERPIGVWTPVGWVEARAVLCGQLAVHPATRAAQPGEDPRAVHFHRARWAVTHARTGREVASGPDRDACLAFASRWGGHEVWAALDGPIRGALVFGDLWLAIEDLRGRP